jgi:hypothetical protein
MVKETQPDANGSDSFAPACELTAELIVGGVFLMLRRMLDDAAAPFVELEQPVMTFILTVYRHANGGLMATDREGRGSGGTRRPVRATYRTTRVLSAIGETPGLSNREIADAAGLSDEGQTSKLLHRLEQRGLVQNCGLGQAQGGSNAWLLTEYGEQVLDATRNSLVPGAGPVKTSRIRGAA